MNKLSASVFLLASISLGLSACIVTPPHVYVQPPSVRVWAPVAPPPPRVEIVSVAPSHDHFWIPGYWQWEGERHRWVDGRWEQRREREHWVPHRWDEDERGRHYQHEGHWERD
jgi:hypothetical protein